MESEKLLKVLQSAPNVKVINAESFCKTNRETGVFNRTIRFSIETLATSEFKLIWYKNQMTLETSSGLSVMFNDLEVSGTWPNDCKRSLQFSSVGETVAVLGLERY